MSHLVRTYLEKWLGLPWLLKDDQESERNQPHPD